MKKLTLVLTAWMCAVAGVNGAAAPIDFEGPGSAKPLVKKKDDDIRKALAEAASMRVENVALIVAGGSHTVVLRKDGVALAWGENASGQLTGTLGKDSGSPLPVPAGPYDKLAAGGSFTVGVKRDGTLWVWGQQIAGSDATGKRYAPKNVPIGGQIADVAAGGQHVLVVPITAAALSQPLSYTLVW